MDTRSEMMTLAKPSPYQVAGFRVLGGSRVIRFDKMFRTTAAVTIGRTRQRHIRLKDGSVSREHAIITRRFGGAQYKIEDWDSLNGIYISDRGFHSVYRRVDSAIIEPGMFIRIGAVTLIPTDASGHCPILVSRFSELLHQMVAVYGTPHNAGRHIGLLGATITSWLTRLSKRKRGACL